MFGVYIIGRLGNQLFQIAFANALSKKHNINFFLKNEGSHKLLAHKYFDFQNFNIIKNSLLTSLSKVKDYNLIDLENTSDIDPIEIIDNLPNNINQIIFKGYYQSEFFFENIKNEIKKQFTVKDKFKKQFLKKYGSLYKKKKTIAIHIRLTDYIDQNYNLPFIYYLNCLNKIGHTYDYNIFFVSDDVNAVRNFFGIKENYYFEHNNEILDFQILQNADILIISNSSFSWWAAYLNNKQNKIVYAPKNWLNYNGEKEFPNGIMTSKWNWIKV